MNLCIRHLINLNHPLSTEVHPLLGVKGDGKSKKKTAGRPKGSKGKDKDFPFRPKPYRGERPSFPVETMGSSGPGGGGGGGGMKGRAEGGLATGKHATTPLLLSLGALLTPPVSKATPPFPFVLLPPHTNPPPPPPPLTHTPYSSLAEARLL